MQSFRMVLYCLLMSVSFHSAEWSSLKNWHLKLFWRMPFGCLWFTTRCQYLFSTKIAKTTVFIMLERSGKSLNLNIKLLCNQYFKWKFKSFKVSAWKVVLVHQQIIAVLLFLDYCSKIMFFDVVNHFPRIQEITKQSHFLVSMQVLKTSVLLFLVKFGKKGVFVGSEAPPMTSTSTGRPDEWWTQQTTTRPPNWWTHHPPTSKPTTTSRPEVSRDQSGLTR